MCANGEASNYSRGGGLPALEQNDGLAMVQERGVKGVQGGTYPKGHYNGWRVRKSDVDKMMTPQQG